MPGTGGLYGSWNTAVPRGAPVSNAGKTQEMTGVTTAAAKMHLGCNPNMFVLARTRVPMLIPTVAEGKHDVHKPVMTHNFGGFLVEFMFSTPSRTWFGWLTAEARCRKFNDVFSLTLGI